MITGILSILFWMIPVPLGIGLLLTLGMPDKKDRLLKSYLFGMVAYLAIFYMIIVPNMKIVNDFFIVCKIFTRVSIGLAVAGVAAALFAKFRKRNMTFVKTENVKNNLSGAVKVETAVLWAIFGAIVVFQMIQAVRLTFPDGDDAYYVGVATYGAKIPHMFSRIPYTGAYTEFDTRHCLAPFSYVISFLSRVSGIEASVIAHNVLPIFFILFAYGIFYLIARQICVENREVPLIMMLCSLLLMFGNYSVYSMETFLMTRTRQGKASLGSFVFPLAFYLMLLLLKKADSTKRERFLIYVLLALNGFVAALCSTMGNLLYPCMLAIGGICICLAGKSIRKLLPMALTCIPNGIVAVIYLIIR